MGSVIYVTHVRELASVFSLLMYVAFLYLGVFCPSSVGYRYGIVSEVGFCLSYSWRQSTQMVFVED